MIVTIQLDPQSKALIARHNRAADRGAGVMASALESAAVAGSEDIRGQLVRGDLGLEMRNPASGLAASVLGWMIDTDTPLAAMGVPADSPAADYARILNVGGTIFPKTARALAVPISDEAKRYESPRDMDGLDLIPRKGKPPLLIRKLTKRGDVRGFELHWVLVPSVRIPAFRWLDTGAQAALPVMQDAFGDVVDTWTDEWN